MNFISLNVKGLHELGEFSEILELISFLCFWELEGGSKRGYAYQGPFDGPKRRDLMF